MTDRIIDLYYFSGTGNTLLASEVFASEAKQIGFEVNLIRMEETDPQTINTTHIIGLACPIAMWLTYPFVLEFINKLPQAAGTKVFLLATMGGSSKGLRGKVKEILESKGFAPAGIHFALMPSNIFVVMAEEKNKQIREKGLLGVQQFAADFCNGKTEWNGEGFGGKLSRAFYKITTASWKVNFLQRFFNNKLSEGKCIKCGLCQKLCPVGNITLKDGIPQFGVTCQYCMRCVAYCPKQVIKSKFIFTKSTYKATTLPYR